MPKRTVRPVKRYIHSDTEKLLNTADRSAHHTYKEMLLVSLNFANHNEFSGGFVSFTKIHRDLKE